MGLFIRKIIGIALLLPLPLHLFAQNDELLEKGQTQFRGRTQEYRIRRLPLSSFPQLPAGARMVLEQRGCLIPQTWQAKRPENVIHGAFLAVGNDDWAALCSAAGESSLLVFRNGMGMPLELARHRDMDRLTATNVANLMGYAWAIDPASPARLRQFAPGQRFEHEGVEESLVDISSLLHFWKEGKWVEIEGLSL